MEEYCGQNNIKAREYKDMNESRFGETEEKHECNHVYNYKYTIYKKDLDDCHIKYIKLDFYFCIHCLEEVIKRKEAIGPGKPEWFLDQKGNI